MYKWKTSSQEHVVFVLTWIVVNLQEWKGMNSLSGFLLKNQMNYPKPKIKIVGLQSLLKGEDLCK